MTSARAIKGFEDMGSLTLALFIHAMERHRWSSRRALREGFVS